MRVPWPVAAVDPHRLDAAAALFFGACLFDSLFATDGSGVVAPALAERLPEAAPDGTRVVLREGLRFASGRPLTARDVVRSIARARSLAGRGWLEPLGNVRVGSSGAVVFGGASVDRIAHALASPLAAIVPEGFTPGHPDGTGPFSALESQSRDGAPLVLTRNRFAAGGPSFLDRLTVAPATDLAASLRAFESGEDNLGWLGLGLHEPRRGSVAFDGGPQGWALLRTGAEVGRWSAPGVAQRLADGIEPSRLAHLGVAADWTVESDDGWGGPPVSLLVRADSPWLLELGRAVAAALSRPDHEVTLRAVPDVDFVALRASRAYALALDVARPFDRTGLGASIALASADDPARGVELARHPPLGAAVPRAACRFLRVGVVASLHAQGGRMPDLVLPPGPGGVGIDFGSIIHPRSRVL